MRIAYRRILTQLEQGHKATERSMARYQRQGNGIMAREMRLRLKDIKDMIFIIRKDQERHG